MADNIVNSRASGSLAHTAGNITSIVTEFYKNMFPKDYFKTTNISTKVSFKHFQNIKDFVNFKKEKPIIAIQPKIVLDESEYYTKSYFLHRVYDNFDVTRPSFHLNKFFNDYEKNISIDIMVNRIKMTFDITLIFETVMQQINNVNYIMNSVRHEKPFYIDRITESQIPTSFIKQLSRDINLPIYDESNSVLKFMGYLNKHSASPIIYKMKYSSGNNEFFMLSASSLFINISKPNLDDGERKGQITDNYSITQTIEVEFNYPGLFYYISKTPHTVIDNENDKQLSENLLKTEIIPLFTIQDIEIPKCNSYGWNLLVTCDYATDKNSDVDRLDIRSILNDRLIKTIQYNNANGIDNFVFFDVKIYKNDAMLDRNLFTVDFNKIELVNSDSDPDSIYRIIIYCDDSYINGLKIL